MNRNYLSRHASEFAYSFSSFLDSVLSQINWEKEFDAGFDFFGFEGSLVGISHELAGLGGDLLEDIENERVHDVHCFSVDTLGLLGYGNFLENFVNIKGKVFSSSFLSWDLRDGVSSVRGSSCHFIII